MKNGNLRVAAYARVSTDRTDQINSLNSQKKYFQEYITHHDTWSLSEIYYDEGVSGTQTRKRSGFQQMIRDALKGQFDLILTKEVSRFARNTVDTLSYTRNLKDHGIGVIFTIDNIDTREPDGELRLTIMASIAQEESRKTSERVKWGQKRRMEQGIVFGRDLLGYTVKNGILTVNETEVPIVRAIFHKYTNEGKGTHVIARELMEEGMHPKRITFWSNSVILRILRNEKYVGDLCQKKTFTPNYLTHEKKYNHGEEEMVYLANHHEPIIDRNLWNRTQKELIRRSPSPEQKSRYSNRYWCSGKLYCAECGNRFVSRTKPLKNNTIYIGWRCHAAAHGKSKRDADGGPIGCKNSSVNDRSLQTCMNYCISLIQRDRESLKSEILNEISALKKARGRSFDIGKIRKKIDLLEEKKRRSIDLMLDGLLSEKDLIDQTAWYNQQLEILSLQMKEFLSLDQTILQKEDDMGKYVQALENIMEKGDSSEEVYKEILDHMEIHQNHTLDIWLTGIPMGIRLKIKTSGKGDSFKTEIVESSFLNK